MASMASAASCTVVAKGPIWSSDEAKAMRPYRDTRPYEGLKPTTPQSAAGWRIEPPVSEPSASGAHRAATAAADPPLDPPGVRSSAHGFRVGPKAEFSVDEPIANSSQFVLPTITAPAASRRSTAVAVYGGLNVSRIFDDAVVRMPSRQRLSLTAIGTPARGPSGAPAARAASTARAAARARSGSRVMNAC